MCKGALPDCDKKSGNIHDKHLDWSSDECSLPMPIKKYGQNPFGWPYRLAARHLLSCEGQKARNSLALVYYHAVRKFGGCSGD